MSYPPQSLNSKVALITGGSRGIGYGIAEQFILAGATVIITGRNESTLKVACQQLGDNAHYRVNDIDDSSQRQQLVDELEATFNHIDILVNNAGQHCKKPALETSDAEFAAVLETNLIGVFSLSKLCLEYMIPRGIGSIINISSMSALFGLPQVAAYSSSKSGLLGLTRTLASEYSGTGVRINAIAPGFIESKMFLDIMAKDPQREERILQRTPMKRFGSPTDIGHAATFLASEAASFITGICLPVDGGNSVGF
ncbi:SDR family NAD(P)-dependent oxidoreductase [Candidatus Colwellia aromaticivorans]|uniref:SDR family NAD(P)-dependent oxidoreductase n=1 Tax=Candidatus Colwellia aromaticivorans TaxID=2267621 RepID=UPI000DF17AB8|nr:SDR family NAD(P)-dependent oxidoreductase [Candidatus Colwellia aromaticivorans]